MSDEHLLVSLLALVFNGEEEEWPKFIVKFQAFLSTKDCAEEIQTNVKSKLLLTEDELLDDTKEARKRMKLGRTKNAVAMAYMTQCLTYMAMLNAIFNVQVKAD